MKTAKYQINATTVHSVGDGNTININTIHAEVEPLLRQVLDLSPKGSGVHQAALGIQHDLSETGKVSVPNKTLLERSLAALPNTEKVVGIVGKVVDMLVKTGVMPS